MKLILVYSGLSTGTGSNPATSIFYFPAKAGKFVIFGAFMLQLCCSFGFG